jgi:hypothetical protein
MRKLETTCDDNFSLDYSDVDEGEAWTEARVSQKHHSQSLLHANLIFLNGSQKKPCQVKNKLI